MFAAVTVKEKDIRGISSFGTKQRTEHLLKSRGSSGIGILGRGFCGTVAKIHLINLHRRENEVFGDDTPVLTIDSFDTNGEAHVGTPYVRCDGLDIEKAFLLTQPANKMSPFSSDKQDFSTWLNERDPQEGENTFGTRSQYAEYLQCLYRKTLSRAIAEGVKIQIKDHTTRVQGVLPVENGHLVVSQSEFFDVKSVIVAAGHPKRDDFIQFKGNQNALDNPFNPSEYVLKQKNIRKAQSALLIGGGPTTLDGIQALEQSGFQGHYTVISNAPGNIWSFEPQDYADDASPIVSFTYLNSKNLCPHTSFIDLRRRLNAELQEAAAQGIACGHVIYQIPLDELWQKFSTAGNSKTIETFVRYVIFLRGAATSPKAFALNRRLIKEGRLKYIRARALSSESIYDQREEEFKVLCQSRTGKQVVLRGELFANCVQFSRRADTDPHFQSFIERSPALEINSLGLINAAQGHGLYVVGPAAQPSHQILRAGWGVESFRDEVKDAAEAAYRRWRDLI